MVFRRDNKNDAFQRQISALRQQLGAEEGDDVLDEGDIVDAPYEDANQSPRGYDLNEEASGSEDTYRYGSESVPARLDDPELPTIPAIESQTTVISQNTSWKGELNAEGSLHLHGEFEGTITAKEDVFILEEARVTAQITATRLVIAGQYEGSVNCGQRLEVLPTGRAHGDFHSPVLVVHEGALLGGKVKMTNRPDAPKSADLVRGQSSNAS